MPHARHITRCLVVAWHAFAVSAAGGLTPAVADDMYDYMSVAEELDRIGPDYARTHGKAALIEQYRMLIDAYPGFGNNMQMETQIAFIHEWDLTESGQPPNPAAAFEVLSQAINTYPPDHAYMKTVRQLAANRAIAVDPKIAKDMYASLMQDFPEEDALVAESLFSLGQIAEREGNPAEAARYYTETIGYVPANAQESDPSLEEVRAYQENAAALMLGAAIRRFDKPEDRLRAMEEFLREHAEFAEQFGDLIHRLRSAMEDQAQQAATHEVGALVPAAGSSQDGSEAISAKTGPDKRPAHATSRAEDLGTSAIRHAAPAQSAGNKPPVSARGENALVDIAKDAVRVVATSPAGRVAAPVVLAATVLGIVIAVRRRFS